ncbi:MAG: MBL fold metallo-hydrolase [Spirochaetes bacterium]|nr:MBL fold metallo-hydrolase [Spirochaetota bacterium]
MNSIIYKKYSGETLILLLCVLILLLCASFFLLGCSSFGQLPEGERLKRIKESPNYSNGEFHNQIPTTTRIDEEGFFSAMYKFLFKKPENLKPENPLPVVKTDLKSLDENRNLIVWLGHSSSYVQFNKKRILIDPVLENSAAPISFLNKAFAGDYPYSVKDLPDIDYIIISHDHWDHLEYPTMQALKNKIKAVICPLGVGSHLEYWGFDPKNIYEGDWHNSFQLDTDFTIHILPARHFSGRWLKRNRTLWAGFILESKEFKVFYSGDTGYGPHFAEIGKKFGSVDLAIIENGQYDLDWATIHLMPEETVQAALDVGAKSLLPVHSGRFAICRHPWYDPYVRITSASKDKNFRLLTPKIGEVIYLDDLNQSFTPWWQDYIKQTDE